MSSPGLAPALGVLRNRSHHAVFLCYHSIADDGPPWSSVPVARFERQLDVLARRGYVAGCHRDVADLLAGRTPRRPLVFLTFDDGFADNATVVAPLLQERGWTGIVFLLPPSVDAGAPLEWPEVRARQAAHPRVMRSLDWSAAEAMAETGMEFGSHTNTHPHLPRLGDEELREELLDSRRRIADRLGRCTSLAYPFGEWDGRVASAAADAGYSTAFTLPPGGQRSTTALSVPRIAIDHRDDERRFALKLTPLGRRLLLSEAKALLRTARGFGTALTRRQDGAGPDAPEDGVPDAPPLDDS
jgi:peptidoglycan/xylan/chitin deacetylase (PgdA/CDA1 family)